MAKKGLWFVETPDGATMLHTQGDVIDFLNDMMDYDPENLEEVYIFKVKDYDTFIPASTGVILEKVN